MKTTVQALKELYATLGGNLADVALIERIPEMIEALNSIAVAVPAPTAEDKGKVITVGDDGALDFANALPPVTAEDAGKVMTVDEQGVWNPAEASGGELNAYYIQAKIGYPSTSTHMQGTDIVYEIPFSELIQAYDSGKKIIAVMLMGQTRLSCQLGRSGKTLFIGQFGYYVAPYYYRCSVNVSYDNFQYWADAKIEMTAV